MAVPEAFDGGRQVAGKTEQSRGDEPPYIELSLTVPSVVTEAVAEMLAREGSGGVVIEDEPEVVTLPAWVDFDPAFLEGRRGGVAVLKAYFPEVPGWEERLGRIRKRLGALPEVFPILAEGGPRQGGGESLAAPWWGEGVRRVSPEDWANAWKAYYRPLHIGRRLVVVPDWEDYRAQPDEVVIRMDPGMAFGTGTHASTALCLRALERLVVPGLRVLDVGTGSGILGIAAALLGAGHVLALDIDPVAVRVAADNARRNGVQGVMDVREGEVLVCQPGSVDLALANLTADILISIAACLGRVIVSGGRLVASGIIEREEGRVIAALRETGLRLEGILREEGWVALISHA